MPCNAIDHDTVDDRDTQATDKGGPPMTLIEKIEEAKAVDKKFRKEHPEVTGTWWEFRDIPMEELREAAAKFHCKIEFYDYMSAMGIHPMMDRITVFAYSLKVKVEQHYVIDSAVKNV